MVMESNILVVEDDDILREAICETLGLGGYQSHGVSSGSEALTALDQQVVHMVISDIQMDGMSGLELLTKIKQKRPEVPVILVTAYGSVEQAVAAIQEGAADYIVKPFEAEVLLDMASRFSINNIVQDDLIASDVRTQETLMLAARVADSDASVMINGESGTGKEVIARYIHGNSSRQSGPFVAINCAAIPETMLESMLFGYEKGAYTGAHRSSPGKFEQADRGTLLLDEISEMDINLQAKILRVLQEREVERLGSNKAISLDVRVIATTNRSLKDEVAAGRFREDLYYRLNVFPISLAPLRDRPGDIIPLAQHFLTSFSGGAQICIDTSAANLLGSHPWPGNVRELENVIQRALILKTGNVITGADLHFELEEDIVEDEVAFSLEDDLRIREQHLIIDALKAENGNRQHAAERLRISPRTLRYKLAKFRRDGMSLPEFAGV